MARDKKYSFPLPRRLRPKTSCSDLDTTHSIASTASVSAWHSRCDESSSKAHRIVGTADTSYLSSPSQTHRTASPSYMSVAVSEASYGSHADHRTSATSTDTSACASRLGMAKRSSSNLLAQTYTNEGGRGSEHSSLNQRLHPQASNSTMRSHYDAKNSPLSISQQTSDSAVRDRALRRGQPPVLSDHVYDRNQSTAVAPSGIQDAETKDQRKSKPPRLDLSKLFPKPKMDDAQTMGRPMLSPEKMVNSPAAMSMASDHFPRPMTREPTPKIGEFVHLKSATRHRNGVTPSPSSPLRICDRDEYDNAKVHVRRPPKGVQHWFDALDEDSDDMSEDGEVPLHAPRAVRVNGVPQVPMPKSSLDRMLQHAGLIQSGSRSKQGTLQSKHDSFAHEDIVDLGRLTSPSQYSVNTHNSLNSNKTKGSALSKFNLQDASVLSFSSSEDDEDDETRARTFSVRKSLDLIVDAGEVIVGQAEAFDIRPHIRRPSAGVLSTRSTTSTNAATIEVMYTPEVPFVPFQYQGQYQNQYQSQYQNQYQSQYQNQYQSQYQGQYQNQYQNQSQNHYPRNGIHNSSRRSSHVRQPSVIHEDEDSRPRTAINSPLSPSNFSIRSARTSASEPQVRVHGSRKMMAVTAEEEALLELMRKKRAELHKNGSSSPVIKTVTSIQRLRTPSESSQDPHRISAFRALEGSSSPAIAPESHKASSTCSAFLPSPLPLPTRGRPLKSQSNTATSHLRDSSTSATSETYSDRYESPATQGRLLHYLPTPAEFSPLEPFPPSSPTPTASVTCPTDPEASHPPSPITPRLSRGEDDVMVKVASSDTSADTDEVAILQTGVIDAQPSDSVKSDSSHELPGSGGHQRRRTASSGADFAFPAPPAGIGRLTTPPSQSTNSQPLSENNDTPFPKVPGKNSKCVDELVHLPLFMADSRVRASSVHSTASRHSSHSQGSDAPLPSVLIERRSSKILSASRGSSVASSGRERSRDTERELSRGFTRRERNSVSDDVLAAWNSLGGTY